MSLADIVSKGFRKFISTAIAPIVLAESLFFNPIVPVDLNLHAQVVEQNAQQNSLSPKDAEDLTKYLQVLSKGTGDIERDMRFWLPDELREVFYTADKIFINKIYNMDNWEAFFSKYLAENPFTFNLRKYLGSYLTGLRNGYAQSKRNSTEQKGDFIAVNEGLARAVNASLQNIIERHGNNLGDSLNQNPQLAETLANTIVSMGWVIVKSSPIYGTDPTTEEEHLSKQTIDELFDTSTALAKKYSVLQNTSVIDTARHPYLGYVKALFYAHLVSINTSNIGLQYRNRSFYRNDPKTIPQDAKQKIADALNLQGRYLDFWNRHIVLVLDNNGLDDNQFSVLNNLLSSVPKSTHNLGIITTNNLSGGIDRDISWARYSAVLTSAVLTGAKAYNLLVPIGSILIGNDKIEITGHHNIDLPEPENNWDAGLGFVDTAVHEFHHIIADRADFWPRAVELSKRTNNNLENLLSLAKGIYGLNPLEFLPVASELYFHNSKRIFSLALHKFSKGFKEPLNQFLLLADIHSQDKQAGFYKNEGMEIDPLTGQYVLQGKVGIARENIPITRDINGRITSLFIYGKYYVFSLDNEGHVVDYRQQAEPPEYPPVFHAIDDKVAKVGQEIKFKITAYDPNNDPLKYSAVKIPEGSNFSTADNMFSWSPVKRGVYEAIFKVSDGRTETSLSVTIKVEKPLGDINGDGVVDILDIVTVAKSFGTARGWTAYDPAADVNGDGRVDIADLVLVARDFGIKAAPSVYNNELAVLKWAYNEISQSNVKGSESALMNLENFIQKYEQIAPQQTTLLPNYPNPFNAETWIPYELKQPGFVNIDIYDAKGGLVKRLHVGFREAGRYSDKNNAVYWDGTNSNGEPVASGIYFYHLQADRQDGINKINQNRRMELIK